MRDSTDQRDSGTIAALDTTSMDALDFLVDVSFRFKSSSALLSPLPNLMSTDSHSKCARFSSHRDKRRSNDTTRGHRKRKRDEDSSSPPATSRSSRSGKKRCVEEKRTSSNRRLRQNRDSSFAIQTVSLYLPLSPIAQRSPLEGLCAEHLSPLILTYFEPLKGVVLAYENTRLSDRAARAQAKDSPVCAIAIDEYAANFVWLTADFLTLKPKRGNFVEGYINVQNESHLGLVCWNMFNVRIDRQRLPQGWRWKTTSEKYKGKDNANHRDQVSHQEVEGSYVDSDGNAVEGALTFRVVDFETVPSSGKGQGFLGIEGTMLSDEEEQQLMLRDDEGGAQDHGSRVSPHKRP